jgi:hypothetical protein
MPILTLSAAYADIVGASNASAALRMQLASFNRAMFSSPGFCFAAIGFRRVPYLSA